MTMDYLSPYLRVWLVDFEFTAAPGERPVPLCCVAREVRSGRLERLWLADGAPPAPPYTLDEDTLFVAFYDSAELGCHLALGWRMPARILDLYAEFRCRTSGLPVPCGHGLLGALVYFGLDGISAVEKEEMRRLAMRGGLYTVREKKALLDYCQSDVDALARLLPVMLPRTDLPCALLRGRYMAAAARVEWEGVPIDAVALGRLRRSRDAVKGRLVEAVDQEYHVFVRPARSVAGAGDKGGIGAGPVTFSARHWEEYLTGRGIPWPRLPSGALALDDDSFKEMARTYPDQVGPVREVLRIHRGELKKIDLTVGADGRNRYLLSAFASRTGRNQPSNSRSIFGPACWLRSLIRPGRGRAVAYCDWSAQELGIAAALSGDRVMQDAYLSGDPYLYLAQRAGAVPADATKKTHPVERDQFKLVSLGVLYGLTADGISRKLGVSPCQGRELLGMHQETFRRYWEWSDQVDMQAMLTGRLRTVFGWPVHVPDGLDPGTGRPLANPRSRRNFSMQANGAEMLRLACCLATERGVRVCAPVHDALLIEAALADIDAEVVRTQEAMREASEVVLSGFPLRTDAKIVRHPDRYVDERGRKMWETVWALLEEIDGPTPRTGAGTRRHDPQHGCRGTPCTGAPPA
jgi:hypothetical protein